MTKRALIFAILCATLMSFTAMSSPAHAGVHVNFGIRVGAPPPPLRHEAVVVRPGPSYTWVRGYWDWRGRSYVWVPGYWARPPHPHAVWVAPRYIHRRHGHYYRRGYWR